MCLALLALTVPCGAFMPPTQQLLRTGVPSKASSPAMVAHRKEFTRSAAHAPLRLAKDPVRRPYSIKQASDVQSQQQQQQQRREQPPQQQPASAQAQRPQSLALAGRGPMARALAAAQDGNATHAMEMACTLLQKTQQQRRRNGSGSSKAGSKAGGKASGGGGGGGGGGSSAQRVRFPPVRELNQLLRALGDGGHLDSMATVFDAMVSAGVRPTQVTYGTLISRSGAGLDPKLASRFYRDMLQRGLQPDAQTLNSLINAYAKAGYVGKAYAAADVMSKMGVAPTLVTYNTLLDACARGQNVTLAHQTLAELRSAGLRPNARTFSILIHMCARASSKKEGAQLVDEAFSWFRQMVEGA